MVDEPALKSVFFYGLFMDEDLLKQKGLDPRGAKLAEGPSDLYRGLKKVVKWLLVEKYKA